jgi:hypothetical protein
MSNKQQLILETSNNLKIEKPLFQKMVFLTNALDQGWTVKKSNDTYIFTKKHENRQEIFQENYLEKFLVSNYSADKLLP